MGASVGAPEQHTGKSSDGGGAAASQSRIKKSGCPSSYLEARLNVADQSRRVTHQNAHGRLTPLVQARKGGGEKVSTKVKSTDPTRGGIHPLAKNTPHPRLSLHSENPSIHPTDPDVVGAEMVGQAHHLEHNVKDQRRVLPDRSEQPILSWVVRWCVGGLFVGCVGRLRACSCGVSPFPVPIAKHHIEPRQGGSTNHQSVFRTFPRHVRQQKGVTDLGGPVLLLRPKDALDFHVEKVLPEDLVLIAAPARLKSRDDCGSCVSLEGGCKLLFFNHHQHHRSSITPYPSLTHHS